MLTSLRLRNFKSFADAQAPFGPLTLLVGANASGKSNVLEALRVLKGLVAGKLSLEQVLQGATGWPGIRGGIREVVRSGGSDNVFTIDSVWKFDLENTAYEYSLECMAAPRPLMHRELLRRSGCETPVLEAHVVDKGHARRVEVSVDGKVSRVLGAAEESWVGSVLALLSNFRSVMSSLFPILQEMKPSHDMDALLKRLGELMLVDVQPSMMRDYVPMETPGMQENGANLSAVLWYLCQDAEQKRELVGWLSELCAPELADIDFSTTDEGEVMLRLIEKDGTRVSARSLSDGTLRFLGELVALRTAPEGSIILLEELGRELHPSRVHLLVEYLESMTEERKIQVIATTHSPLVLQALSPKARKDVVVLGRVPDVPGTIMKRVGDLPRFEEVVERRGLDYLFTTNWLEQAL